jgi:hypothetical protein
MPARDYSEEEGNPAATQADHGHLDTIEAASTAAQVADSQPEGRCGYYTITRGTQGRTTTVFSTSTSPSLLTHLNESKIHRHPRELDSAPPRLVRVRRASIGYLNDANTNTTCDREARGD